MVIYYCNAAPKARRIPDEAFLSFTLAQPEEIEQPLQVDFGDGFRLEGYTLTQLPIVDQRGPHVQLTTYWRTLDATPDDLRPIFSYARADGAVVYQQTNNRMSYIWRSTDEWQNDQLYKLSTPALQITDNIAEVLLAVAPTESDPDDTTDYLRISPIPGGIPPDITDSGTMLRLLDLPR